jgi:hypothetical protein
MNYKQMMNWKGCGKKRSWPNLIYYPGICLEGLRKARKILSQYSRSPDLDFKSGPPEYVGLMVKWISEVLSKSRINFIILTNKLKHTRIVSPVALCRCVTCVAPEGK